MRELRITGARPGSDGHAERDDATIFRLAQYGF